MKLDRKMLMFFASFDATRWQVLGVDNDDLAKELNPDTETGKNVLGESTFRHSGYEPEISMEPYYADNSSPLFPKLLSAAIQEKYGDADIKGHFVQVPYAAEADGVLHGIGFKQEAYIVPQSAGGDTSGFGLPFTINPVGAQTMVDVAYTAATHAVTITPVTDPSKLFDLSIEGVSLSFDPDTTTYTGTTTATTAKVSASPLYAGANVEIMLGGDPIENGSKVTWSSGSNTLTVKVTVDSFATTYTATITKS